MSHMARGTKAAKKGDVGGRVGLPGETAQGPSSKQLRDLLHVLKGTPAGVVQQVGHLMMLFVAVVKKQAIDLLQHAKKEIQKKKKAGKARRRLTNLRGGTDGAEKAKRLQRWAAKSKTNARQLLKLVLGSRAALEARPGLARLLKLHAQDISSEEARKGSSAAAAAFDMMITIIDGVLSDDSSRITPALPTPSSSEPNVTVGGEEVSKRPTSTIGQTSICQQQLLKQLPREPLYPMPASYTPEFSPENASKLIEASLSPLWSACSEDSVRGNATGATMMIEEALSKDARILVAKPWPSPLWSSSSEESVRGNATAAAIVIEAALLKQAQASSSKEIADGVEDAVERWPSSGNDGDDDDDDDDDLAGKRSTSRAARGGGDVENGAPTPTPSACAADVVDDSSAGQPTARQGSLILDDEVSNTSGFTWVTAEVSKTSGLTWMTAEGGESMGSPRTTGVTLEQALVLPPGVTMRFDKGASTPSETLSWPSSGAGSFGDTRLADN
ncbi:unnamed protein product, partial [Ectocarpus sp. 12 AP-2014]